MARIQVSRGHGHPWTKEPGWDQMEILSDSEIELEACIDVAEAKFWQPWMIGKLRGTPVAVMYKPSGATSAWTDPPR